MIYILSQKTYCLIAIYRKSFTYSFEEYKAEITRYETALATLKKSYSKLPNSKDILDKLDTLQEKKNTLMQEYSSAKSTMDELYQIRKNYGIYMGKEMERQPSPYFFNVFLVQLHLASSLEKHIYYYRLDL